MGISHVLVDEVHQNSEVQTWLLLLFRDILVHTKDKGLGLRVLLMSTTPDVQKLQDYCAVGVSQRPVAFPGGRTTLPCARKLAAGFPS